MKSRDDTEYEDVNVDTITFSLTEKGEVTVHLTYFRLPPGKTRLQATLTMTPTDLENFADSLKAKAQEARASTVRH